MIEKLPYQKFISQQAQLEFVTQKKYFAAFIRQKLIATEANLNHNQKAKHTEETQAGLLEIFVFKIYFKYYKGPKIGFQKCVFEQ